MTTVTDLVPTDPAFWVTTSLHGASHQHLEQQEEAATRPEAPAGRTDTGNVAASMGTAPRAACPRPCHRSTHPPGAPFMQEQGGERELPGACSSSCIILGWPRPFAPRFSSPVPSQPIGKPKLWANSWGRGQHRWTSPRGPEPHRGRRCRDVRPHPSPREGFLFGKITRARLGRPQLPRTRGASARGVPDLCPLPSASLPFPHQAASAAH